MPKIKGIESRRSSNRPYRVSSSLQSNMITPFTTPISSTIENISRELSQAFKVEKNRYWYKYFTGSFSSNSPHKPLEHNPHKFLGKTLADDIKIGKKKHP